MCLFKKKKVVPQIETKYHVGDPVSFRRKGELMFGWIYEIHAINEQEITYDIQCGGQCPAIYCGYKEEDIRPRK